MNAFSMVWCVFSIVLRVFCSPSVAHAAVVSVRCPTYECVFMVQCVFLSICVCVAVAWVAHVAVVWMSCPTIRMCFPWCGVLFLSCCVCFAVAWVAHVAVVWVSCPAYECIFYGVVCVFYFVACVLQYIGRTCGSCVGVLSHIRMCFPWCGVFSLSCCVCFAVEWVAHVAVVWVSCPAYECVEYVVCVLCRGVHGLQLRGSLVPHMNETCPTSEGGISRI